MLRLAWIGTYVQTQHDDQDIVVGQGPIPIVHDQDLVVTEARIGVDVGISRRFAASLVLPVRVVSTSIRYLDASGAEVMLSTPSTHHRNETVSGLADPMVLGAMAGSLKSWRLTARAGLTVPIGRTERDPFVLGDMGLPHQHIQMGTGTVNPVLAFEGSRSWGAWRFGAFAFTQQALYANGKGYRAGDRYAGGGSLRYRLRPRWSVRGGVEVQGETAEQWGGITHTDDGNRGRFDAMLGAGASWSASNALSFDLGLKIPVVTHAVGGQLKMPALVEVGASWSFGARKPAAPRDDHKHEDHEHHGEHGHDHDDHDKRAKPPPEPDTKGLDVADLGKPGEAVDLAAVPGKLTIFDFWAAWCEPCKTLEPALIELARAHPNLVAIRRIDAVDWDSAVVARYLTPGGFNLPHVKIVDPSGKQIFEQSSEAKNLQGMIDAIRAVVKSHAPVE